MHWRFLRSELRVQRSQLAVVIACVALAILSIVSIGGFSQSVNKLVQADARSIAGGDIVIDVNRPYGENLTAALSELRTDPAIRVVDLVDFSSIVSRPSTNASLFVSVRAVSEGYPAAGTVALASGRSVDAALTRNAVIVDESAAARLGLAVGDTIALGESAFTVSDIVLVESMAPVSVFSNGRVLVRTDDLNATGLVGERSRVEYLSLLSVPQARQAEVLAKLQASLAPREDAELAVDAAAGAQRFLTNTLFFIRVISLFTLLLAGLAMTSAVRAILRRRQDTIGVAKVLGMTDREVLGHYLLFVAILGTIGTALGIVLGLIVQQALPVLFAGLLPQTIPQTVSWLAIGKGVLYGLVVTVLFSAVPLLQLRSIRPNVILRHEVLPPRFDRVTTAVLFVLILLITALITIEVGDLQLGLYFIAGFCVLILLVWLLTKGLLALVRLVAWNSRLLELRLAARSLLRSSGSAASVITALGVSLTLLFAIVLLQQTIQDNFVASYPPDAPNVFVLDVDPAQRDGILAVMTPFATQSPQFFPVVRGGLRQVRGGPIDLEAAEGTGRDPLTRDFSLTYGSQLLPREVIRDPSSTGGLFDESLPATVPQVSVLAEVADRLLLKPGDTVTLRIQGFDITATVSSIRERTSNSIEPFFYFQFDPRSLADAPATAFIAAQVAQENVSALQDTLASSYPAAVTIDVSQIARVVGDILARLTAVIRFFTSFSMLAGVLLLLSAVLATSVERTQEGVYYSLVGARKRFLLRVALIEYFLIGVCAAVVAALFANAVVYGVATYTLDLPFTVAVKEPLILAAVAIALVVLAGTVASRPARRAEPMQYLRENAD